MYKQLEENFESSNAQNSQDLDSKNTIITFGRVCNMIGEINKKKTDFEAAIKFYLRGIS